MVIQRHVKLVRGLLMLHGQLPLRLMISAIAVHTSSRTIATVHEIHLLKIRIHFVSFVSITSKKGVYNPLP